MPASLLAYWPKHARVVDINVHQPGLPWEKPLTMGLRSTILIACSAAVVACSEPPVPVAVVPVVRVATAAPSAASEARAYSGAVVARHETPLAFRVGGKMVERLVEMGSVVRPGQVLARLDTADLLLQLSQAQAQRQLAEAEARRYRHLKAVNFISQSALDSRETALGAADAQASLALNQTSYAVLRADRAGVITQVAGEPGQVLAAGQTVFRLAEAGAREVSIAIPENQLDGLAPGAPAEVSLWTSGQSIRARLRELAPIADPVTRTFAARVTLLDTGAAAPLGATAQVRFARQAAPVVTVPHTAVFQDAGQAAVWVVKADNTLERRPVVIATFTDAGTALDSGLKPGERVVVAGANKLVAAQEVRPQP